MPQPGAKPSDAEVIVPTSSDNAAIAITGVQLSYAELLEMGENAERPGEVMDLYHTRPPTFTKTNPKSKNKTTTPTTVETTPRKEDMASTSQTTPRRSPRGHSLECLLFIVIKFSITDLTGVDPRLDVPKILIFAHGKSPRCHSVVELRDCLQDKSNDRLRHQFDMCRSIIYISLL